MRSAPHFESDSCSEAGAKPASDVLAGRSQALADILATAPFGLEISNADKQLLFANDVAVSGDSAMLRARAFDVRLAASDYSVKLWLDETADDQRRRDLFHKAYFDALTGLPNRSVLEQSVAALIKEEGAKFALAFIDLDRFRHVNDYFGTAAGDALLVKVAERISFELPASDLVARLAGNSFVLLLSITDSSSDIKQRLEVISQRIREPFFIDGQEIFTAASIGVSLFPQDGHVFGTLNWNAERAMRGSRLEASGGMKFYDRSIERAVAGKNRTEQRLRFAVRDRRVSCAFQPKVDLRTGEVLGVEALMRWRDEDGIIQPPGEMLSIASELGLMDDVAQMVLEHTVGSVDRIREIYGDECTISINVAARQAGSERFMRDFVDQLANTGFPQRFVIEVTEEAFLAKENFQTTILPMIREAGAQVSIDDFGTGYSSLSALANITADELKIDRAFVTDVHKKPRSQNVLKAIEALGHSLNMRIVVEGVETIEELAYLQNETRIHLAQGYFFARPVMIEDQIGDLRVSSVRALPQTRPTASNRR